MPYFVCLLNLYNLPIEEGFKDDKNYNQEEHTIDSLPYYKK